MGVVADWLGTNWKGLVDTGLSIWNTLQGNKNVDESLEMQKQEYENTREFNKQQAIQQNEWNIQQWQRENDALKASSADERAYNSYSAQKARMQAAGLNPDMMYGASGSMVSSPAAGVASSPSMSGGSPASPMDWSSLANKRPLASSVDTFLDRQYKQAMIDNVNANTKKQGAETSILTDEAAFTKALKEGELKMQDAQIKLLGGQYNLTSQQITESQSRCQNLEASTNQLNALADSLRNSIKNDNVRLTLEKKINEATIKNLASQTNLNYEEAKRLSASLNAWLDNLNADTSVKLGQNASLEISNGRAAFDAAIHGPFNWNKDLNFFDNMLHFAVRYLETASTILGPVINAAL